MHRRRRDVFRLTFVGLACSSPVIGAGRFCGPAAFSSPQGVGWPGRLGWFRVFGGGDLVPARCWVWVDRAGVGVLGAGPLLQAAGRVFRSLSDADFQTAGMGCSGRPGPCRRRRVRGFRAPLFFDKLFFEKEKRGRLCAVRPCGSGSSFFWGVGLGRERCKRADRVFGAHLGFWWKRRCPGVSAPF